MKILQKTSILLAKPKLWFWLSIVFFTIGLAYFLPMFLLVLYANLCCTDYDAGISAASMMFAISRPAVLIIEAIILITGPFIAWISFLKNKENPLLKLISTIIGIQFSILIIGIAVFFIIINH
ncbi:hypothetical protein [Vampirovibrio sp.]|uniref:hypothetical protein n=1 Tax=Vampirovibrio sp. TaxID=2717857 RepID=UPI00359462AF